jgi:hypothetical protein
MSVHGEHTVGSVDVHLGADREGGDLVGPVATRLDRQRDLPIGTDVPQDENENGW